jgi:hypothetical protein
MKLGDNIDGKREGYVTINGEVLESGCSKAALTTPLWGVLASRVHIEQRRFAEKALWDAINETITTNISIPLRDSLQRQQWN